MFSTWIEFLRFTTLEHHFSGPQMVRLLHAPISRCPLGKILLKHDLKSVLWWVVSCFFFPLLVIVYCTLNVCRRPRWELFHSTGGLLYIYMHFHRAVEDQGYQGGDVSAVSNTVYRTGGGDTPNSSDQIRANSALREPHTPLLCQCLQNVPEPGLKMLKCSRWLLSGQN